MHPYQELDEVYEDLDMAEILTDEMMADMYARAAEETPELEWYAEAIAAEDWYDEDSDYGGEDDDWEM